MRSKTKLKKFITSPRFKIENLSLNFNLISTQDREPLALHCPNCNLCGLFDSYRKVLNKSLWYCDTCDHASLIDYLEKKVQVFQ